MKIKTIIENLCSHKISKRESILEIKKKFDTLRKKGSLEFEVQEISYTTVDNHAYLKLKLPYGYDKIKGKIEKGDKVDVTHLPI